MGVTDVRVTDIRVGDVSLSLDPCKVQSTAEWVTPTSCAGGTTLHGAGQTLPPAARNFVQGYAELAAALAALGSPMARFACAAAAQASFDTRKERPVLGTGVTHH